MIKILFVGHRNLLVTISLSLASPLLRKLGKHIGVEYKVLCPSMFRYMYVCLLVHVHGLESVIIRGGTCHQRVFYANTNIGSNWYYIVSIPEMRHK